eukprot:COSAG01_NODE_144_length_24108_cov_11.490441_33_plen_720_part_00
MNQMHPFYPALLMLLPLALAAPNKPRRSADERLDAVESFARHALARLNDLEERVTKMEQPTTTMKDEIAAIKTVVAAHGGILSEHSRLFTNHSEQTRGTPEQPKDNPATGASRRLQQPPSSGRVVHIHSTSVHIPEGPGWRTSGNYNGGHRRTQGSASCGSVRAQAVQTECCNEPSEDCSGGAPRTCNPGCAAVFLPFWSDCAAPLHLQGTPLYQQTVALCRASAPAGSGAGASGGAGTAGSVVQEFRLVCTDGSTDCVPQCDSHLHGDLLLLAVNGEDSKFSCEMSHGKYSWIGPASDGGYFGSDALSFLAAVITHAPGLFMCSMTASVAVSTPVDLIVGQHAALHSNNLTSPVWRYQSGDGAAFVMEAGAELNVGGITVASSSGLAFRISAGATITTSALQLLSAGVSSAIQCAVLGSGIGRQGLACDPVVGLSGVLRISGPLIITTSGLGFGTGSTQYIGENYEQFRVAVSRTSGSLAGFYTLQLKQDTVVSAVGLMIQSTMHVSIIGDDSRPAWQFPGSGSAFTVQNAGFLILRHIKLSKPRVIAGAAPLVVVNLGGQATIDTSTLTNVGITAHGTLRLASSQLTDVQLLSDHGASVSLDSVTVIGTSRPLTLPVSCAMGVTSSQLNNVRLQVDVTGRLTLSHTVFRIMGVVATVATGGSMTVSSSQLVHGSATDPFPCDGHDMHCTGPHAQPVTLSGPASINTDAPLICPPGGG